MMENMAHALLLYHAPPVVEPCLPIQPHAPLLAPTRRCCVTKCLALVVILLQAKLKTTFASFDADMDGQIDMSELRALLSRIGEMPSEKHLQVPWHRKNDRGQRQLNVSGMCVLIIPVREQTTEKPGELVAVVKQSSGSYFVR